MSLCRECIWSNVKEPFILCLGNKEPRVENLCLSSLELKMSSRILFSDMHWIPRRIFPSHFLWTFAGIQAEQDWVNWLPPLSVCRVRWCLSSPAVRARLRWSLRYLRRPSRGWLTWSSWWCSWRSSSGTKTLILSRRTRSWPTKMLSSRWKILSLFAINTFLQRYVCLLTTAFLSQYPQNERKRPTLDSPNSNCRPKLRWPPSTNRLMIWKDLEEAQWVWDWG